MDKRERVYKYSRNLSDMANNFHLAGNTHQSRRNHNNLDRPDNRSCHHDRCLDHQNTGIRLVAVGVMSMYKSDKDRENTWVPTYTVRLPSIRQNFWMTRDIGQQDTRHKKSRDKLDR